MRYRNLAEAAQFERQDKTEILLNRRQSGAYVLVFEAHGMPYRPPSISPGAQPDITQLTWLCEVVFDYGEGHYSEQPSDAEGGVFASASINCSEPWPVRQDPFSKYRSCFEVRTYPLSWRALMFHHFQNELGIADYLVRATEFELTETPITSFITGVT